MIAVSCCMLGQGRGTCVCRVEQEGLAAYARARVCAHAALRLYKRRGEE